MKNRVSIILGISLVLTVILINQRQRPSILVSEKKEIAPSQEMTNLKTETTQKSLVKDEGKKSSNDSTKEKEILNSKVVQQVIEHFDNEFGSDIRTTVKVLGNKNFKRRPMKVVRISHQKQSGVKSSYLAIVNPNNGHVEKTWSRTKFENFRPSKDDFAGFRLPSSN